MFITLQFVSHLIPRSEELIIQANDEEFEGCSCTGTSQCSTADCTCIAFSYGANYSETGLLNVDPSPATGIMNMQKPIIECSENCFCVDTCKNSIVAKGNELEFVVMPTDLKGRGLCCKTFIQKGSYVGEYLGEVYSKHDIIGILDNSGAKPNFTISLIEHFGSNTCQIFIDASRFGNTTRFINHSCEPNLIGMVIRSGSLLPRLALFALKDIPAQTELTFNYGDGSGEFTKNKCFCMSKLCSGYLPKNFWKIIALYDRRLIIEINEVLV